MPITRRRWSDDSLTGVVLQAMPWRIRTRVTPIIERLFDVKMNQYDVILAHFGWNGRKLAQSSRLGILRRPFATVLHGIDLAEPYNQKRMAIYRTMFQQGALLLPVCSLFRDMAIAGGADPARTIVLPTGVDCRSIPFLLRDWGGSSVVPSIVTVARMVEKKGIEFSLRALAQLKDRAPELPWRYDIIGDGELRPTLEQLAVALDLGDRVTFHGALSHNAVMAALRHAHIFLLSSVTSVTGDMEGIPVVIYEAMAAGLLVISSRHSGIPEVVEHGVNGLLADERDAEGLSHHIEWALRNPTGCNVLAKAARATVEQRFDSGPLNDRLAQAVCLLAARSP